MATGGRDDYTSDTGLDLREVESELQALDELELDTTDESLFWEEHKAQTEYEKLAETSGDLIFQDFTHHHHLPLEIIQENLNLRLTLVLLVL